MTMEAPTNSPQPFVRQAWEGNIWSGAQECDACNGEGLRELKVYGSDVENPYREVPCKDCNGTGCTA